MMQEHAIYISTCRGPVTDEKALIDALNSGSIYGAGLDVLDPDPSPDSPLLDMENVIVLPHVSFRANSLAVPTLICGCGVAAYPFEHNYTIYTVTILWR